MLFRVVVASFLLAITCSICHSQESTSILVTHNSLAATSLVLLHEGDSLFANQATADSALDVFLNGHRKDVVFLFKGDDVIPLKFVTDSLVYVKIPYTHRARYIMHVRSFEPDTSRGK
jgi:hypothetical protein